MTIIGLDDTDSRRRGMCTTYLATRVAERIEAGGATVHRRLLVRLNPAVEHKTRGNAALAIHTDLDPDRAFDLAAEELSALAETADPRTSPGLVVAPLSGVDTSSGVAPPSGVDTQSGSAATVLPESVGVFARDAVTGFHTLTDALDLLSELGWRHRGWGDGAGTAGTTGVGDGAAGRGRIGALAAIGAPAAFEDWTYEGIAYREFDRCGTPREVDHDSVFAAADIGYPDVWDTVDRAAGVAVCVPNAPGPILYGIRGDDPDAIRRVMAAIDAEPVERTALFLTNQGTDVHLQAVDSAHLQTVDSDSLDFDSLDPVSLRPGGSYRLDGTVTTEPETRRGGHVFVELAVGSGVGDRSLTGDDDGADGIEAAPHLTCVAFEPTKRFRDRVRALRPGDRLTVCGELDRRESPSKPTDTLGTLKLEKFAVRSLVRTEPATPVCPDCDRTMESAGRDQGYRCRDCGTTAPGKRRRSIDRDLEIGWYEVPPLARRHIAKPLVRGGFDAPIHPER